MPIMSPITHAVVRKSLFSLSQTKIKYESSIWEFLRK